MHRVLGRLYGAGVLIGGGGGFYLALTTPAHLAYSPGRFMLCVAWVVTTDMALYVIRRRRLVHVPDDPVATDLDTLLAWAAGRFPRC